MRDQLDQGRVRAAIDGRCREANLQGITMLAGHLAALRPRLDMHRQAQHPRSLPRPIAHGLQEHEQQLRADDGDQR